MNDVDRRLDAEHPEAAETLKSMNWDERLQEARAKREAALKRRNSAGKPPDVRIIDAAAVAHRRAMDAGDGTAPSASVPPQSTLLPTLTSHDPEPAAPAAPIPRHAEAPPSRAAPSSLAARTALGFGLGAGLGLGLVLGTALVMGIFGSGSMPDALRANGEAAAPVAGAVAATVASAPTATAPSGSAARVAPVSRGAEPMVPAAAPVALLAPPAVSGAAPAALVPRAGGTEPAAPPSAIAAAPGRTSPALLPAGSAPGAAPTAALPPPAMPGPTVPQPAPRSLSSVQTGPPPAAIALAPTQPGPAAPPPARAEALFRPPQAVTVPHLAAVAPIAPQDRPTAPSPGLWTTVGAAPRLAAQAPLAGPARADTPPAPQIVLVRPDIPAAATGIAATAEPESTALPEVVSRFFVPPYPALDGVRPVALAPALPGLTRDPSPPVDTAPRLSVAGAGGLSVRVAVPQTAPEEDLARISAILGGAGIEIGSVDRVPYRISASHLRYFHPRDAQAAAVLAGALNLEMRDFTRFRPAPPDGMIEVFVAGDRIARATPMPPRPASSQRVAPRPTPQATVARRAPPAAAAPPDPSRALQNRILERLRRGEHLR